MKLKGKVLPKTELNKFLKSLRSYGEVYGPVKKDVVKLEKINDVKDICFDEHLWFPPKQFIFPEKHVMFKFEKGKFTTNYDDIKPTVLFGLRKCDLQGFAINDKLFLTQEFVDPHYKKRRENLLLVGLYCYNEMDKYCFCESMELDDHYDLMLLDRGDYFHVKSGSKKGEKYIKNLKDQEFDAPKTTCKTTLDVKQIKEFFTNDMWNEGADKCLSCGHCTNLCPTCLCFTIEDDMNLDRSGERVAKLDSCQFKDFTKVAGGHVFRESRVDRFKHRIYHKLEYFKEKFDLYMCTGCGRCIRGCPEKIDWIELIHKMDKAK